jgi:hypothetical protein
MAKVSMVVKEAQRQEKVAKGTVVLSVVVLVLIIASLVFVVCA